MIVSSGTPQPRHAQAGCGMGLGLGFGFAVKGPVTGRVLWEMFFRRVPPKVFDSPADQKWSQTTQKGETVVKRSIRSAELPYKDITYKKSVILTGCPYEYVLIAVFKENIYINRTSGLAFGQPQNKLDPLMEEEAARKWAGNLQTV